MVLPFGLTNALATCRALINNVLRPDLDMILIAYLDDILIYSKDKKEHVHYVQDILECLSHANLFLKPEKCQFHKEQVEFLGCLVETTALK